MKNVYQMVVVGAGGTGTTFLRDIGRYLNNREDCPIKEVLVVDGDTIESKNIERQMFFPSQVGMNKAAAMEQMLHRNFPKVRFSALGKYLTSEDELNSIFWSRSGYGYSRRVPLIIGCVDNNAARVLLEDWFLKQDTAVYFDSGNDYAAGEVVFSFRSGGKTISPVRSHYFPEIRRGDLRPVTEMSCTELNAVDPQHPLVNIMAGEILTAAVVGLCEGRATDALVDFDAHTFYMEARPIDYEALKPKKAPSKKKVPAPKKRRRAVA